MRHFGWPCCCGSWEGHKLIVIELPQITTTISNFIQVSQELIPLVSISCPFSDAYPQRNGIPSLRRA